MLHFTRFRTLVILGICLLGILACVPNLLSKDTLERLPEFARHRINLGLDLRGGAHLLTAMDLDELRKDWMVNLVDDVRKKMREAKLGIAALGQTGGGVQLRLANPADAEAALKALKPISQIVGNPITGASGADIEIKQQGADIITLTPTEIALKERASQAISSAIEVIRRRLDPDGTKEVTVQRQGNDRILVQQPGIETEAELDEIRKTLRQAAKMTFHLVHPTMTAEEAKQTRVPAGYMIVPSKDRISGSGDHSDELIETRALLTGDQLADAQATFGSRSGEPVITFRFNQSGARIFGKATTENVGRRFAIVLDGQVISAPVIREPIIGGSGEISGSFTPKETNQLAIALRSGALPAKLTIVEERVVGASLGQDSIDRGKRAAIIGMVGVAAFMIFAYGLFGTYAVLGAALHVVFVLGIMSILGSTMTLPGIAGVVLTIGMAVDANVLIYERIREELRNGKTPISAIDAGFHRAYATIIDSQLTTFIAGLLMFLLGAGPIRGFAITLTLGIITTVFTAFTVTRLCVYWWLLAQSRKAIPAPL